MSLLKLTFNLLIASDANFSDAILRNAVLCTACSAYANTFGTRVDLVQARRRYARALSLTNDALRDVESARKDQTLVAVLLLNLFEVMRSVPCRPISTDPSACRTSTVTTRPACPRGRITSADVRLCSGFATQASS